MLLLKESYSESNLQGVMCRNLISIDWKGYVYDCDFNQMLGLPLKKAGQHRKHLSEIDINELTGNPIVTGDHCYGCTAGQGCSCSGAL